MDYSTHYFVRHIDVYHRKNEVNINIHARDSNLLTKIKAVVNGIITAGVGNDTAGTRIKFRSLLCVPQATGHLGGGLQYACRRHMQK